MSVKLLTPPANYAICKMEERNYPGIVVQGDSFSALLSLLKQVHKSMSEKFPSELDDEIVGLEDQIDLYEKVLLKYERVCRDNNFGLPYAK